MLAQRIGVLIKSAILSIVLLLILSTPALAQTAPQSGSTLYLEAKKAPGIDLTKWTTGGPNFLGVLQIVGWGFIDDAWGISQPVDANGNASGAIPSLLGFMGSTYIHKPASLPQYLAYVQNRAGFPVKPAYAQFKGGFEAMRPVIKIWELMRNIVYLFFVVVFVAVGFMIMFRKKLNPQTTISIQLALPGIVVSLILVTFSYAISGLIIDISELGTRVIATIFKGNYFPQISDLIDRLTNPSVCTGQPPNDCLLNFFSLTAPLFQTGGITDAIQNTIKTIAEGLGAGGSTILSVFSGVVIPLVFTIAMLQTLIKGFFMLLTAYVNIVLSTIFSPFVFLANSFTPGAAGQWFKSFLTNALVFPVTFLLLALAALIVSGAAKQSGNTVVSNSVDRVWNAEITDTTGSAFEWFPAPLGVYWKKDGDTYTYSTDLINYLVAFGLLLALPRVSDMIKGAFEHRESGVGEGVSQTMMGALRNIPIIGGLMSG